VRVRAHGATYGQACGGVARLTALATATPGAARTAAAAALHAMLASRARGRAAGASGQAHASELVRVGGLALCRVLLQVNTHPTSAHTLTLTVHAAGCCAQARPCSGGLFSCRQSARATLP